MGKFQENLKQLRRARGFKTAKAFAAVIDVPYTTYINYEEHNREPSYDRLCRIADALQVPIDTLLGHRTNNSIKVKKFIGEDGKVSQYVKFDDIRRHIMMGIFDRLYEITLEEENNNGKH